jgi:uncharacterized membrane protein
MSKFVVVTVPSEPKAYEALQAMNDLHAEGSVTLYAAAVVERNEDGTLSVKQAMDEGPLGFGVGALVGGLIGVIGGPAGYLAGTAAGGLLGGVRDYLSAGVSDEFMETVTRELSPGTFAVIAEVSEDWVAPMDVRMEAIGGRVTREWRDEFVDETFRGRIDAYKSELDQRKAERAGAKAEKMEARLEENIDDTRRDLEKAAHKARERLDKKKEEMNAKLQALLDQAAEAAPDVRERIEQRIAELRAELQAREEKLNQAWSLAQEALNP